MSGQFDSQIILEERYRDTVSGYEGVATAISFYLHGCERVTLEQWIPEQGVLRELTFDTPRLIHVDTATQITSTKTGGAKPDMRRRGVNP